MHAHCVADYLRHNQNTAMTATNEKSEYIESLIKEGKKAYSAKLTLSNGKQLPDPFFLHSNRSQI